MHRGRNSRRFERLLHRLPIVDENGVLGEDAGAVLLLRHPIDAALAQQAIVTFADFHAARDFPIEALQFRQYDGAL